MYEISRDIYEKRIQDKINNYTGEPSTECTEDKEIKVGNIYNKIKPT